MHIRLRVAAEALNAGYNVLLSDADAVFISPVTLRSRSHSMNMSTLSLVSMLMQMPFFALMFRCFKGTAARALRDFSKRRGRIRI